MRIKELRLNTTQVWYKQQQQQKLASNVCENICAIEVKMFCIMIFSKLHINDPLK